MTNTLHLFIWQKIHWHCWQHLYMYYYSQSLLVVEFCILFFIVNVSVKKCVCTSEESEVRTLAAAVIKSPTSMVKPGKPRKKNRGEQERMMVFKTSWSHTHTHTHTHMLINNYITLNRNKQLTSIWKQKLIS